MKDSDTERKDCNMLIFVLLPNRLGRKITETSSPDSIKSLMNNVLSMKNALDSTILSKSEVPKQIFFTE